MKERKLCKIKPPHWMGKEQLQSMLDAEKLSEEFEAGLPTYYMEIGNIILSQAHEAFGKEIHSVKNLLFELSLTRMNKLKQKVTDALTSEDLSKKVINFTNLSHTEINAIRPCFLGAMDMANSIVQLERSILQSGMVVYSSEQSSHTGYV
eukprot:TRINITY_DN4905_c0_g2_i2.p4 TRINITY_DN4905_c0_g2~~TRINITY_DN4905_c0_g2_i2.p4  ORF type:complete len:150 (-),score=15.06 TRINITY_DN4905_c0_g2_i2:479-928(-)